MNIPFTKYQGAGNDFVLIDFRRLRGRLDFALLAQRLCERHLGIGADGLILLFSSSSADYKMRIFNADGSEPSMCGNGIRCLYDFIQKLENTPAELKIETPHGILACRRIEGEIAVNLGIPRVLHWPIELPRKKLFVINTGVPHAVLFVDQLDCINVSEEGAKIRFHPHFAPIGVNVNFVSIHSPQLIALRTYERGVEAETLACGTGAAAAAFVAMKHQGLTAPISVLTRLSFAEGPIKYRQDLRFQFCEDPHGELQVEMLGGAQKVFKGIIDYED